MRKRETFKRLIQLLLSLINVGIQVAVFADFYLKFYSTWFRLEISSGFYFWGHVAMITVYSLLMLAFSKMYGALRVGYQRNVDVIISQIIGTLFTNVIMYIILSLFCMELMNIVYYTPMTIIQLVWAGLWTVGSSLIYRKIFPPKHLLLLSGNRPTKDIVEKFESRKDKYIIDKTLNVKKAGFDAACEEILNNYDGVVIWDIPTNLRNDLLKFCYGKRVRVYIMPKISDVILYGAEQLHIFDSPILLTREYTLKFEERVIKRAFDLLLSAILIVLTSPFMLITAILVKAYDKGPVFYKQVRCTTFGREFKIIKFRSMRVDAEKDGVARLAKANDDRITPIGKFIRKVRLDELPQLFNIFVGDMSFIGPRPERPEIIKQYVELMPEFEYRTKVKAGLAGYAQVYGKYNTTPYDKLKLDLCYIENYSIWLDLKLMLLTIKILFLPDATEGVAQDQVTAFKESCKEAGEDE